MIARALSWAVLGVFVLGVAACSSSTQNKYTAPGYTAEPQKIAFASSLIIWPGLLDADVFTNEMQQHFQNCGVDAEFIIDLRYNSKPGADSFSVEEALQGLDADQYEALILVDEAFERTAQELVFDRFFKVRYYDIARQETVWQSEIRMRPNLSQKNRTIYLPKDILKYLAADGILARCSS